jgi:predicted dinucleotide-binding enzyme
VRNLDKKVEYKVWVGGMVVASTFRGLDTITLSTDPNDIKTLSESEAKWIKKFVPSAKVIKTEISYTEIEETTF